MCQSFSFCKYRQSRNQDNIIAASIDAVARNEFDFVLPTNFVDNPKYYANRDDMPAIESIPAVVLDEIYAHLPAHFPADVLNVFYYVRRGFMPPYVVNWFMDVQGTRASNMTRFYKALHMIERLRSDQYGLAYEGYTDNEEDTE